MGLNHRFWLLHKGNKSLREPRAKRQENGRRAFWTIIFGVAVAFSFTFFPQSLQIPSFCPFRLLAGLPCPFCGLVRSVLHTTHLDIGKAIALHPLGPVALLALLLAAIYSFVSLVKPSIPLIWDLTMSRHFGKAVKASTALLGIIWVLRLLGAPFLHPLKAPLP